MTWIFGFWRIAANLKWVPLPQPNFFLERKSWLLCFVCLSNNYIDSYYGDFFKSPLFFKLSHLTLKVYSRNFLVYTLIWMHARACFSLNSYVSDISECILHTYIPIVICVSHTYIPIELCVSLLYCTAGFQYIS